MGIGSRTGLVAEDRLASDLFLPLPSCRCFAQRHARRQRCFSQSLTIDLAYRATLVQSYVLLSCCDKAFRPVYFRVVASIYSTLSIVAI